MLPYARVTNENSLCSCKQTQPSKEFQATQIIRECEKQRKMQEIKMVAFLGVQSNEAT